MADGGMTTTGLNELRAAVEQFPAALTAALRNVAHATAKRVEARAAANLLASRYPNDRRAVTITVEEDAANQQFTVTAKPASSRYAGNVTIWIEHGTLRVSAQPFMRTAAQAENAQYRRDLEAAAEHVAQQTFR